ncbi:T6SS immunity protein Tli4 family protein [Luteimonas sp. A501]
MKHAGLAVVLLLASTQAACTPASQTSPKPDTHAWLRPWHVEQLTQVRAYAPAAIAGMQRECLGRLAFEVMPDTEWATDRLGKIEDSEFVEFADGVPGDRQERLAYGDLSIWVSAPATHADMQKRHDHYAFVDGGSNAEAWERGVAGLEAELEAAKQEGPDAPVFILEERLTESRVKLEDARHRKRLDFGLPDELSYDDGAGQIRIRFLLQGRMFTIVRDHPGLRDGDPRRDAMLAELRDVLSRFRARAPGDVPDEPGVCLPHAFIADDGTGDYHTHASFRYPDRPGVVYSIDTGYRPPDGERGTAWMPTPAPVRVMSYPATILEVFRDRVRDIYPITPRGAHIGPYNADQGGVSVNVAKVGEPDVHTYTIFTGLQGIAGLQTWPFIGVEAQTYTRLQYEQLAENPPPQAETQTRLDALLKSTHLRRTTVESPEFAEILDE